MKFLTSPYKYLHFSGDRLLSIPKRIERLHRSRSNNCRVLIAVYRFKCANPDLGNEIIEAPRVLS